MTETSTITDPASVYAQTFAAYVRNGENKAQTARELNISDSTVRARVKRYQEAMAEIAAEHEDAAAADEAAYRDGDPEPEVTEDDEAAEDLAAQDAAGEPDAGESEQPPADRDESSDTLASMPADGHLAYQIACRNPGCGAEPFKVCVNIDRGGKRILSPYPHPVRVDDAGARPTQAAITAAPAAEVEPTADGLAEFTPEGTSNPAPAGAEHGEHDGHDHGQAAPEATEPAAEPAEDGLHTHCVKCGWDFGQPIKQSTCGSAKMCAQRVERKDPNYGRRARKA